MKGLVLMVAAAALGCSTHHTTLIGEAGKQVIYRLSENQTLEIAKTALVETFPGKDIHELKGARRGYIATWRVALDTFSQRVIVIPAIGTDMNGQTVRGYWVEVSGSGSAIISGPIKNSELFDNVRSALNATGTGVAVTNARAATYDEIGPWRGQPATPEGGPAMPTASPVERLRQLKELHDEGLISDSEYETKRQEILRGM